MPCNTSLSTYPSRRSSVSKQAVKTDLFDLIRPSAEKELVRVLEEDYGLAQYYDIFDNREELEAITQEMLNNTVLLNRYVAPRLYDLCARVQTKLGFDEQIDFYVMSTPEMNAFSINGFGFVPHIVCLNSGLIQLFTDDELMYVIGHEIGHIIYQHSKLNIAHKFIFKDDEQRPPAAFTINYLRAIKHDEISADRVGFCAIPDLGVVTSAIFKLHYGLPAESLNFQTDAYLKQLDRIKELGLGDLFSTHPNPMIRLKALIDFSQSRISPVNQGKGISIKKLDQRLAELMELLEVHPKSDKDKRAVEFLSAVGTYLIYDQEEYERKWNFLYDRLSDYTTRPEIYLDFPDLDAIKARLDEVCEHFKDHNDDLKFELLKGLVYMILLDGRLEATEKQRLQELGTRMDIAPDTLNLIIRQVSEVYLAPNSKVPVKRLC